MKVVAIIKLDLESSKVHIHAGNWKYAIHPMEKSELKIKNPTSYLFLESLKCLIWCLFVTM